MTLRLSYVSEAAAGTPYSLTLKNESASDYTLYVFQKTPDQETANIFSLAWFASPFVIVAGNQIQFDWSIDYSFVWGATGHLVPGVTFQASGVTDADPAGANTTGFSVAPGPHLTAATQGDPAGSLVISDSSDVPNDRFSVGIGMSGAGTFAVQAGPNLTHTFTPTPTYWIGAGSNISIGKVLEITTNNPVAQVTFPPNVYDLTYVLDQSNEWVPDQ
ncbi:MAG: hypothetical protein L0H79_16585 [Intrasporangium sp.]|uniref:hypothetical protein n=1 Tax=Intrasporangium sp. TaxID=1925024 RepID=UPI002647BB13|nr:hypothetical protein [Intrasporangium sp.]MDN5797355.1 hypothetical protein [Intrasporangium sp.]